MELLIFIIVIFLIVRSVSESKKKNGAGSQSQRSQRRPAAPQKNRSANIPARTTPAQTQSTAQMQSAAQPIRQTQSQQSTAFRRPTGPVAQRHEDWMPLPSGMHTVTCHYCGAENAVPDHNSRRYTCYFCREEL